MNNNIFTDNINMYNTRTPTYLLNNLKSFLNVSPVLPFLDKKEYTIYIEVLDMNINNLYDIETYEVYNYFTIYFQFMYIKQIYRQYQEINTISYLNSNINLIDIISNLSINSNLSNPTINIYIKKQNIYNTTQKNIIMDIEYGNIKSTLNHLFIRTLNNMENNIEKIFNHFSAIPQIHSNNKNNTIINYVSSLMEINND